LEASSQIEALIGDSQIVFVCGGLGGGTGSGAIPVVTKLAKERNAITVAIVTLPFKFEGKRREKQAFESLAAIEEWADVVICFENDRMADSVSPSAGVHQAFVASDHTISQAVRSLVDLLTKPGVMHKGFDDVMAVMKNQQPRCLFGYGESTAENRSNEALEKALWNPLMDKGRMLEETSSILVQIIGGPSMTLFEVQIVMEELGRNIDAQTQIFLAVSVDAKYGNRLSVALLGSVSGTGRKLVLPAPVTAERLAGLVEPKEIVPVMESPKPEIKSETPAPVKKEPAPVLPLEADVPAVEPVAFVEPARSTKSVPPTEPAVKPKPILKEDKIPVAKQETMQFEAATRGRFEKSEPTIIDGQDLDVPTFMRKRVRIKDR